MSDYKIEPHDSGLYEHREDEYGRGEWMRVATYPPNLPSLSAVLEWYAQQEEEDEP